MAAVLRNNGSFYHKGGHTPGWFRRDRAMNASESDPTQARAPRQPRRKRVRPLPKAEPARRGVDADESTPPEKRCMEVMAFDPEAKAGARTDQSKRVSLELSVPGEDDECGIGMEPIGEYRLEWLPPTIPHCVLEDAPSLTKATITECGHGFNALALLYHFLKNEMTCPFCRRGHARARMSWESLPPHLRLAMRERLEKTRWEERREQTDADAADVQMLVVLDLSNPMGLTGEVNPAATAFAHLNRQSLILYAYTGEDSAAPLMVQEIALDTSISSDGTLRLSSYLHSMRELTRNLRLLPVRTSRFELVVASRRRGGGVLVLYRSRRFASGVSEVEVAWGVEVPATMRLEWVDDRIGWGIASFTMVIRAGQDLVALIGMHDQGEVLRLTARELHFVAPPERW